MNCPASYGPIAQSSDDQLEPLPLSSPMGWMRLSHQRQACSHPGLPFKARETNIWNLKNTWIRQMKQEGTQPSRWHPTSNELLFTTIEKSDHVPSKLGIQSSKKSLRIRLNRELGSSKKIGKDLTSYLKLKIQGLTICKCQTEQPCSAHGMCLT